MLASWANAGRFDRAFYALQGVELVAGAINITLLVLNMRDGSRLASTAFCEAARAGGFPLNCGGT